MTFKTIAICFIICSCNNVNQNVLVIPDDDSEIKVSASESMDDIKENAKSIFPASEVLNDVMF